MKIFVPTKDERALEAETFGHVGGAPYYTIADTDSGYVQTVPAGHHDHESGECGPGAQMRALDIDTVVCGHIGRRAMASLEAAGITVFVSDAGTVREVLADARNGGLRAISAAEACAGHGARHGECGAHDGHHRSHRNQRDLSGGEAS